MGARYGARQAIPVAWYLGRRGKPATLPRERARAPERKRTRNKNIKMFRHVHVYEHEHVHVISSKVRPQVSFASLSQGSLASLGRGSVDRGHNRTVNMRAA